MKIKELRTKLGISQLDLAKNLGIHPSTLFNYETGRAEPNIKTLIKLADYYHVSLDELVGRPTNLINKMLLSDRERSIIEKVLSLNPKLQELTEFYIDTLMNSI